MESGLVQPFTMHAGRSVTLMVIFYYLLPFVISVGIVLASLLFMRNMAQMTRLTEVQDKTSEQILALRSSGLLFSLLRNTFLMIF